MLHLPGCYTFQFLCFARFPREKEVRDFSPSWPGFSVCGVLHVLVLPLFSPGALVSFPNQNMYRSQGTTD